jgi:hypothetical protein
MPDHPSPGKRTPAAVSGDAHPIMPTGGMVTATSATGKRHAISSRSRCQRIIHGSARIALASAHSRRLGRIFATPKYPEEICTTGKLETL